MHLLITVKVNVVKGHIQALSYTIRYSPQSISGSHDFVSQALPFSRATLKSWVEPGGEVTAAECSDSAVL